jgi:hypothetical protein
MMELIYGHHYLITERPAKEEKENILEFLAISNHFLLKW